MSTDEVKKNLSLSAAFSEYVLKNPDIMEGVPPKACIIFTGKTFPALSRKNLRLGKMTMKERRIPCYRAEKKANGWAMFRLEASS